MKKLLQWINYWLVPINATEQERLNRIREVGFCIGIIIGFIGFIGWVVVKVMQHFGILG